MRRGLLLAALCLVVAVVAVRTFVLAPLRVGGESMAPTLHDGQVVLLSRLAGDDVRRGDLVVFSSPEGGSDTVKRVVGLAGDRVVIRDAVLSVNDRPVEEPYVDPASVDGLYTPTTRVPAGHVFVLGDNRAHSVDSRHFGNVPLEAVQGSVVLRLWPPGPGPS